MALNETSRRRCLRFPSVGSRRRGNCPVGSMACSSSALQSQSGSSGQAAPTSLGVAVSSAEHHLMLFSRIRLPNSALTFALSLSLRFPKTASPSSESYDPRSASSSRHPSMGSLPPPTFSISTDNSPYAPFQDVFDAGGVDPTGARQAASSNEENLRHLAEGWYGECDAVMCPAEQSLLPFLALLTHVDPPSSLLNASRSGECGYLLGSSSFHGRSERSGSSNLVAPAGRRYAAKRL